MPLVEKEMENLSLENDWPGKYEHNVLHPEDVKIFQLSIILTEKCSLRCKYCTEYMPYLHSPQDFDIDDTFSALGKVLDAVNGIRQLHILGGEVFVHPQWHLFVKKCIDDPRIGKICVLTNATIIPKDALVLKNTKCELLLDDYKFNKIDEWKQFCQEQEITYRVVRHEFWHNVLEAAKKSVYKSKEERYENCLIKSCWNMTDGFLYRCTTSFFKLKYDVGMDVSANTDFIDLRNKKVEEIRAEIKRLLKVKSLSACEYCPGTYPGNLIGVAEQMDVHDSDYRSLPR